MKTFFRPLGVTLLITAAGAATSPAFADWNGKGQAGVVISSGNSESKAGNVKLALGETTGPWTNTVGFNAVYASDSVSTTSQRWELLGQTNYKFDAHNFVFGGLRYEDDRFGGYKSQATLSGGVGHQFIDTADTKLSGQVGLGYKRTEKRNPNDTVSALAYLGQVDFRHSFNASTTLLDKLSVEATSDNTYAQNELSLEVKMSDKLALAVGYAVRYNSDPPPAFKKTDTLTTMNLVYQIK
jgi:putative salt-induced outer membrane protein